MSRLRSPTSASTSTTVAPRCASAVPRLAVVVVLPTPPLPDVTTIARPSFGAGAAAAEARLAVRLGVRASAYPAFKAPMRRPKKPWFVEARERNELALEAARDFVVDRAQPARLVEHDRLAPIRRVDDFFVVGHDAEQLDREDLADVVDREHVAAAHHLGAQAVDDQPHRLAAVAELADDAVGVANRAHFGRRHDDRFVGAGDRVAKAGFDAGRAVDEDVVRLLGGSLDDRRELLFA